MTTMDDDGFAQSVDKAIGDELRTQREAKRMSRADLEALSGVSAKSIQRFEEGQRSPITRQLVALTRALGVPTREFVARALKDLEP